MNDFTQGQLLRLLAEMIQIGIILEVQAKPLRYKVRFKPELTSDWIPSNVGHAGSVKQWQPLQAGEQVLVLKQFNTQGGVIVASLNQKAFDQPKDNLNLYFQEFPDGTWVEYDMEEHKLTGHIEGDLELTTAGNATITATQNVDLNSLGDMSFNSDGKMSFHSKGEMTQTTEATMSLSSQGKMMHSSDDSMSLDAPRIDFNQ